MFKRNRLDVFITSARDRILSAQRSGEVPAKLQLGVCITARRDQAVFRATLDTQAAIVKLYEGARAVERATRSTETLRRLSDDMSTGENRIPALLWAEPRLGLVVMSNAEGVGMDVLLQSNTDPKERALLISRAGGWFGAFCRNRAINQCFVPRYWVTRCFARLTADAAVPDDIKRLQDAILSAAAATARTAIEGAACHGDFVARNLLVTDDYITGIDVQGAFNLPMARDLAMFLVWLAYESPPDDLIAGVGRADVQALCLGAGFNSPPSALCFFIGEQLLMRRIDFGQQAACPEKLSALIADYCGTDLQGLCAQRP